MIVSSPPHFSWRKKGLPLPRSSFCSLERVGRRSECVLEGLHLYCSYLMKGLLTSQQLISLTRLPSSIRMQGVGALSSFHHPPELAVQHKAFRTCHQWTSPACMTDAVINRCCNVVIRMFSQFICSCSMALFGELHDH